MIHDEILRDTSPDRQVDAVVHEVNTGAMDDYTGWVFLVPHGGRVWPWSTPEIVVDGSPGRGGWKDRRFLIVGGDTKVGPSRTEKTFGTKRYDVVRVGSGTTEHDSSD